MVVLKKSAKNDIKAGQPVSNQKKVKPGKVKNKTKKVKK
jgi:hypothetical protein